MPASEVPQVSEVLPAVATVHLLVLPLSEAVLEVTTKATLPEVAAVVVVVDTTPPVALARSVRATMAVIVARQRAALAAAAAQMR